MMPGMNRSTYELVISISALAESRFAHDIPREETPKARKAKCGVTALDMNVFCQVSYLK